MKKKGEGAFGVVYLGKWRSSSVAIKQAKKTRLTEKSKQEFIKEAEIMQTMRPHNNVIYFLFFCKIL